MRRWLRAEVAIVGFPGAPGKHHHSVSEKYGAHADRPRGR
jgi:hypothetical protein